MLRKLFTWRSVPIVSILVVIVFIFVNTDTTYKTNTIPKEVLAQEVTAVEESNSVYSPDDLLRWWTHSMHFRVVVDNFQESRILPERFVKMVRIAAGKADASSKDLEIAREFLRRKELLSQDMEHALDTQSITAEMVDAMFRYGQKVRARRNAVARKTL